jgi:hypothetical protein
MSSSKYNDPREDGIKQGGDLSGNAERCPEKQNNEQSQAQGNHGTSQDE